MKRYLYFVAAFFCFLLAYLFYSDADMVQVFSRKRPVESIVQKSVGAQLEAMNRQLDDAEHFIESNSPQRFSGLGEDISSPIYIYADGQLLYWSDHTYVPDYEWIKNISDYKYIRTDAGKLIVIKRSFDHEGRHYEIAALLKLSFKYPFRNKYLKSGYNKNVLPPYIQAINGYQATNNIFSPAGGFLFSVETSKDVAASEELKPLKVSTCVLAGFILLFIGIRSVLQKIRAAYGFDKTFLALLMFMLSAKAVIFISGSELQLFPWHFTAKPAQSSLEIFLTDPEAVLVNLLIGIFCLSYLFRYIAQSRLLQKLISTARPRPLVSFFILLTINELCLQGLLWFYSYIFIDNRFTIEVVYLPDFNYGKFVGLMFMLGYSALYFMLSHLLARFWLWLEVPFTRRRVFFVVAALVVFMAILWWQAGVVPAIVSLSAATYIAIVVRLQLPLTLNRPRYITYLYLFLFGALCSLTGALAAYNGYLWEAQQQLKFVAEKTNREGENIDLGTVYAVSDSIALDPLISGVFTGPMADYELVEQKIYKFYIGDLFDKFETNIYLFDIQGTCINKPIKRSYFTYLANFSKPQTKTPYKNIFQVKGLNPLYYSFIEVQDNGIAKGYAILEFKLRKVIPNSVYPELLTDGNFQNETPQGNYSYAIYSKDELVTSYGDFNYFREFRSLAPNKSETLLQGRTLQGKIHRLFTFPGGKSILVSVPAYTVKRFFSNFSFLFLIQALLLAIFIFSNTFYYKLRQVSTTFTTKIQLYINFAFFVPLAVTSVTTFWVISRSFRNELQSNFIKKAESISASLVQPLTDFNKKKNNTDELSLTLNQAAKYVQSDINLYDARGHLLLTTQPQIFEAPLLSPYLNPQAYALLVEDKEKSGLLQESIGELHYNTVYYRINSYDTGELMGILAIPYFESNKDFREKLVDVFTTILNIFTAIFLLFLLLTYYASGILTVPLALLTSRIKQTSLTRANEPLVYRGNDEIGLLVKEYNKMIHKLEENKQVLAATEKETAWREMAKQVAHEIKNPLTPMKLTLQNLQRLIKGQDERLPEATERAVPSLLDQVENLSEIATSFSAFTQMPVPRREQFDVCFLLQKTVTLYQNNENVQLHLHLEAEHSPVTGDEKLMNRIIINLLANAFESVPAHREAVVEVKLEHSAGGETVRMSFSDNGDGIPPENREKVFQPNFSTKTSGSGIGLAVAKRGIDQMGGKIWFASAPGFGTTFFIEMPLVQEK